MQQVSSSNEEHVSFHVTWVVCIVIMLLVDATIENIIIMCSKPGILNRYNF